MSNQSEARAAIAAAASQVVGVDVSAYYRQQLKPGTGSVQFSRVRKPSNGFGWIYDWTVTIATSTDARAHERWLEDKLEEIFDALSRELEVASAEDAQLVSGEGGAVYGVVINGYRGES